MGQQQIKSEQLALTGNHQSFDHSIAAQSYHFHHQPAQQVLQSGQLIESSNSQQLALLDHQANYPAIQYIGNTEIIDPYHHAYVQQYVQQTDGGSLSHSHLVNPHVYHHNSLLNNGGSLHHQQQLQSDPSAREIGQTVIISDEYSPMTVITTGL